MYNIDKKTIDKILSDQRLVFILQDAFEQKNYPTERLHADFPDKEDAKLLIMPAWLGQKRFGVKIISSLPDNAKINLPTISGLYVLFDADNGRPLANMDASALTCYRTAAISALASKYLSRPDSEALLLLGTGALIEYFAKAHCQIRPIKNIYIWGRNYEKAKITAEKIDIGNVNIAPINDLDQYIGKADIISSATSSKNPIIKGQLITKGTHVDLVGSFSPQMREADDNLFAKARIFVDTKTAKDESGDLIGPLEKGIIKEEIHDLSELLKTPSFKRKNDEEITVFKSVGTGLADIATANYVYEKYIQTVK